jgi:multiple sugar transport system permease protein
MRQTAFDRVLMVGAIALAVLWMLPLLWVFALSLKSNAVLMERTDALFSTPFTLRNYADILANSAVFRWVLNSCVVAGVQTLLVLLLSSLAGYGFARCEFRGKRVVFALVLAGLAVPEPGRRHPAAPLLCRAGPAQQLCRPDPAAAGRTLRRVPDDAVLQGHSA